MEEWHLLCYGNCIGCETESGFDLFYCERCSCIKEHIVRSLPRPVNFISFRPHATYKTEKLKNYVNKMV